MASVTLPCAARVAGSTFHPQQSQTVHRERRQDFVLRLSASLPPGRSRLSIRANVSPFPGSGEARPGPGLRADVRRSHPPSGSPSGSCRIAWSSPRGRARRIRTVPRRMPCADSMAWIRCSCSVSGINASGGS